MGGPPNQDDVRMRGFAHRTSVDDAWRWVDVHAAPLAAESVPLAVAAGRVLAEDVVSDVDVPAFRRAMMDGFAIQAADTLGASAYNPLPLRIVGESLPARAWPGLLEPGTAVRIMTGSPLPAGADAVIPAEQVEWDETRVRVLEPLAQGKNIAEVGEDIARRTRVLPAGRRLRPQDIGVLASTGCRAVMVVRRPRVRIAVTGNELLPAGSRPAGLQIVDANGPMLSALVQRDGGLAENPGIVPDDAAAIRAALLADADVILISGGSSVGQEDLAPRILAAEGELAIHGIAMRPSSPAGIGRLGPRLVFLLPGHPVSCLCAYDFFAGTAIRRLGGRRAEWPYRQVQLPLQRKLVSAVGRVDYARVRILQGAVEPLSISGASILSSTTRADGFVVVPSDSEGYPEGHTVGVYLYDG